MASGGEAASFDDVYHTIMAIDGVYQKRVMNLTDDDIHHIKGSKKAYEHCSKVQQPGQKKMDI